jgi:hypothetical protein
MFGFCVLLLLASAVLIIEYHLFYVGNDPGRDFLNHLIFRWQDDCCSWWPMTHFVLFFIIGTLVPDKGIIPIYIMGILWEVFENIVGRSTNMPKNVIRSNNKLQYNYLWWSGSLKDVWFNGVGLCMGYVFKLFLKNRIQRKIVDLI